MKQKRCYGCMKLKPDGPVCPYCGFDESVPGEAHRLPAGTVLKEQYLVGKVLGQGGFGITYLGWDLYLDIPVAIKEYYPVGVVMRDTTVTMDVVSCTGDEGARFRNNKERFLREAKMLARFSQVPEIVQVRNFFLSNNTAYIVMEYVEGITLKQFVKDSGGTLGVEQTLSTLRPIVEALCRVHKAGLVHRDISPDNIMMLPGGGVKLLDFGAVRDVGAAAADKQLTKSTEAILKQGFAPIEQYQKRGSLGPWTDVYALCATIFYCLTGQVPPDAPERLLGYEDLNLKEKVPALSEVQVKALEHGMELRAENRTTSMDDLYAELFQASPPSSPPTPPPPSPSPSPKRRWLLPAVAAVLVVAALALVWMLVPKGDAPESTTPKAETPVSTSPAASEAITGTCGKNLTWALENGTLTIAGTGEMEDYRSDQLYSNDYPYPPWQEHRGEITAVVIGEGVRNVGECAFFGYDTVKSVTFSSTVTEIDPHAFWGCGMEKVELPEKLKTIGEGAFSVNPLKNVVFPDSVEYIGPGSFDCNDLLESVTIGPNTRLNYDMWYGSSIFGSWNTDITIRGYRNSMAEDYARILGCEFEAIGQKTWFGVGKCGDNLNYYLDRDTGLLKIEGSGDMWDFNGTWMLSDEHKHNWVDNRELPPWSDCRENIRVVSIGDGITSIGENAFEGCENLVDVYFGNTVERIGTQSFLSTAVDEIVLPESVTKIAPCAFNWCRQLWKLTLPEGLAVLEDDAIAECMNLRELYIGRDTVIQVDDGLPLTNEEHRTNYPNLTICGLQNSDAERFAKAYGIPFAIGVRGMKAEAQGQCGDDVWWFKSGDTLVLYGTGDTWLYRVSDEERQEWGLRDWPESWLHYGNPEFYTHRYEIRRILILPGVRGLNHNLFCDMAKLTEVDFGTVISTHCTFLNCHALEEVVLPESMTVVGEFTFHYCKALRRVTIENGSNFVGGGLFANCVSLDEVHFSGRENIGNQDLFNPHGNNIYSDHVTFYVKKGSDALRYAKEKGISYEIVE